MSKNTRSPHPLQLLTAGLVLTTLTLSGGTDHRLSTERPVLAPEFQPFELQMSFAEGTSLDYVGQREALALEASQALPMDRAKAQATGGWYRTAQNANPLPASPSP